MHESTHYKIQKPRYVPVRECLQDGDFALEVVEELLA